MAWRLEAVDPSAHGQRRRLDLPMIGREAELDLLRWALDRTDQTARPHLVTVLGQPGIGKSRLVVEVARLAPDLTVLTGHCRATPGASSLEPLLEVARAALPEAADAAAAIADVLPGDPDAAAVAACLVPERTAAAPDIGWAVSRLIGSMATEQTVVIVLEDVHWADDLLLDVVEQLLGRSRRQSLLVVCTARPEFAERRPAGARARTRRASPSSGSTTRRPGACWPTPARRFRPSAPSASSPRPRATRCSPSTWRRWSATTTLPAACPARSRCS